MTVDRRLLKERSWFFKHHRFFAITGGLIGFAIIFSGPIYFIGGNKLETLEIPESQFKNPFSRK